MNLRPSGYEPDELPGCSTPRYQVFAERQNTVQVNRDAVYPDIDEPLCGLSYCRGNSEAVAPVRRFRRLAGANCRRRFVSCKVLLCFKAFGFKSKRPLARPDVFGRAECVMRRLVAFCRPGSDRLSRVLRRSTIGAGAFHGRVRNGNGCSHPAMTTRSAKRNFEKLDFERIGNSE